MEGENLKELSALILQFLDLGLELDVLGFKGFRFGDEVRGPFALFQATLGRRYFVALAAASTTLLVLRGQLKKKNK